MKRQSPLTLALMAQPDYEYALTAGAMQADALGYALELAQNRYRKHLAEHR